MTTPLVDTKRQSARLLADLKPHHVTVYVTKTTSVNGFRLSERLTESGARVDIQSYEPESFVHAKLIGVTAGRKGWLLSGSANLSQVAMIRSTHNGGNVELSVFTQLESEQIPTMFVPPGMTTVSQSFDSLTSLSFQSSEDYKSVYPAIHLIVATILPEGRIEIFTNPPCQHGWFLDDFIQYTI